MEFTNFIQIDSFDDLIKFEEEILGDTNSPFSDAFIDWSYDEENPKESKEYPFEPGVYFIWYEKTFDRMGPLAIKAFQRVPDNILNMKDIISDISIFKKRQKNIGIKMGALQKAFDSKDEEKIKIASDALSKEEFDEYSEINEKLNEFGYSHF